MLAKISYGIVFWSHHINTRTIRRITAALTSPLRRCLALPPDANTHAILTEFGLPTFENLRSVTTIRFIQSLRLNHQPQPVTKFFRSLHDLPPSTPKYRQLLQQTVCLYTNNIGLRPRYASHPYSHPYYKSAALHIKPRLPINTQRTHTRYIPLCRSHPHGSHPR
jgi:hypothetical protein